MVYAIILLLSCFNSTNSHDNYFGCWKGVKGQTKSYDIILTKNEKEPHTFQFGSKCKPKKITTLDVGKFRNDTLIIDNGKFEYWCHLKNDTLTYSSYSKRSKTFKFVKAD